jgi:hypothetical protein
MKELRLALLADGSSDRALIPILHWTLRANFPELRYFGPDFVKRDTSRALQDQMEEVVVQLRPDVLFVHRDAEAQSLAARCAEIPNITKPVVRVVPVRMTETWLLLDEQAIRAAADNPNGAVQLGLPAVAKLESLTGAKDMLCRLIVEASELNARRKEKLKRAIGRRVQLVSERTADFLRLRALPAFTHFEAELRTSVGGAV